jgi:hypothetical protein
MKLRVYLWWTITAYWQGQKRTFTQQAPTKHAASRWLREALQRQYGHYPLRIVRVELVPAGDTPQ